MSEVSRLLQTRQVSPVELTRLMLDRLGSVDAGLHSYWTIMADQAMDAARTAEGEIRTGEYRGRLHGVPIGVKDLLYTRGVRTTGGMAVLSDFVPDHTATAVARLEEAGAIVLGKLATAEGAFGTYHDDFAIPLNPWDTSRWAGISSSGCGVSTAAGLCFGSLGTDTGGSIRIPAALNGVVGLKPTYGRVSRYGVIGLSPTLDHVCPMARQVSDVADLYEAIAGFDAHDPTSLQAPVGLLSSEPSDLRGLQVGFDPVFATHDVEPGLVTAIDQALDVLRRLGAEITDVQLPDVSELGDLWFTICLAEAAAEHAATFPSRQQEYGPYIRELLDLGRRVTPTQLAEARRRHGLFNTRFNALVGRVDALVYPTTSCAALPISEKVNRGSLSDFRSWRQDSADLYGRFALNDSFNMPANFSGCPALTVPCGFSVDGLPYGMQFVGAHLKEATLLRIGRAYEDVTEWHSRHPSV